jgi:hypothetical protein
VIKGKNQKTLKSFLRFKKLPKVVQRLSKLLTKILILVIPLFPIGRKVKVLENLENKGLL